MFSPDKNDVDISKLFNWGSKFTLPLPNGEELTCYLRVIGDEDLNKSRAKALRKSAELRKKLRDSESDERAAFIPDLSDDDKERYVDIIVSLESPHIIRRMRKEVDLPYPKDPRSDASTEELEKHQEAVDEWPTKFNKELTKLVQGEVDKRKQSLMNLSVEEIKNLFEKVMIDSVCEAEMMTKFQEYCVYYGTYADSDYTTLLFKNFEQFENLPKKIKDQFITFYGTLDIDIEELKK